MTRHLPTPNYFTVEEYLRLEADSVEKHEYRGGEIIAMAGGSPEHSLITANLIGELRQRLKGKPCRVYDSNLRVRIPGTTSYAYPDLSVICGPAQFDPQDRNRVTATNPKVVIEVLTPSTEADDRGEKFRHYLALPSLEEYVLVSQLAPRVESYHRREDGTWLFAVAEGADAAARFRSLGVEVPFTEVYAGVEFPPEPERLRPI